MTPLADAPSSRCLLIFDINHVLMKKGSMHIRPFVQTFFADVFDDKSSYQVAIWSAMQAGKTRDSVIALFDEKQQKELLFVWTHEECQKLPDFQTTRSAAKVWKRFTEYGPDNTLFFVNDAKKVEDAYQSCVYAIPSFEGPRKGKNDQVFATLKSELDRMKFMQ